MEHIPEGYEFAGTIGVDSGLCWIGDPCYCVTPDADEHPAPSWNEFCNTLEKIEKNGVAQWNYKGGSKGLGVSVSTGYGDGSYNVYVKKTKNGRIAKVLINFISSERKGYND